MNLYSYPRWPGRAEPGRLSVGVPGSAGLGLWGGDRRGRVGVRLYAGLRKLVQHDSLSQSNAAGTCATVRA